MHEPITTTMLAVLTLLSLGASVLAVVGLRATGRAQALRRAQHTLLGFCTTGCMVLWAYRAVFIHQDWQPLKAHVDGLLLIALLCAVLTLFLQRQAGMRGLTIFALPVLTLLLTWSVCASAWTFEPFDIDSVWKGVHLVGVYLGTLFVAIAAICGGMFLYVQHRLRRTHDLAGGGRLASLEAIETLLIRSATLGFALLTMGLITGGVIHWSTNAPWREAGPLYWSKIGLAIVVWGIYAVVMNVRYATAFRGARAAWLCIVGLILLLTVFGVVSALPATTRPLRPTASPQRQAAESHCRADRWIAVTWHRDNRRSGNPGGSARAHAGASIGAGRVG